MHIRLTIQGGPTLKTSRRGSPHFSIRLVAQEPGYFVHVQGPIDASTVTLVDETLSPLCSRKGAVILLDASKMTFINSKGYDLLFRLHRITAQKGGRFVLFGLSSKLLSIMRLLGLDRLLCLRDTRREALDEARAFTSAKKPHVRKR